MILLVTIYDVSKPYMNLANYDMFAREASLFN